MGNLPEEINLGAVTLWAIGYLTHYDKPGGNALLALAVLAGVVKLADFSFTFYKNHIKKK